ncbi:7-cyano-7-deazaguanine synthase QueC [Acidobacteriota bacterium]
MCRAIVLFSGGIDSTTALYWSKPKWNKVFALSIDYGQRHRVEIETSKFVPHSLGFDHRIFRFDLSQIGGSALTDPDISLPQFESEQEIGEDVPDTYVPFRNGIFLSIAAAWADVIDAEALVVGFNVVDSPNYPDTGKEFINAMQRAVNLGTRASASNKELKIYAPFVHMKKSEIIHDGLQMGADYSYSISCYSGQEKPCCRCSACRLRQKAWEEVGCRDHLLERLNREE